MGRAPPRLINHFGAINFERQSKQAAIASDSGTNGPEDVATGPRAQARPKIFAPDIFLEACGMRPATEGLASRRATFLAAACSKLVAHRRASKNTLAP